MASYGKSDLIAEGTNADIDNAEEDIVVVTDLQKLTNSQLTAYITYSLGTNTSMKIRYKVLGEVGGTWHTIPLKSESDGTLDDVGTIIDSNSPASPVIDMVPLPACMGFKVTGQGAGGSNSSVTVRLLGRDN